MTKYKEPQTNLAYFKKLDTIFRIWATSYQKLYISACQYILRPIIQFLKQFLCWTFQNSMTWPQSTKTYLLNSVLVNGPLWSGTWWGDHWGLVKKQPCDFCSLLTLKISFWFMYSLKSYSIFTFRQTYSWKFCIPIRIF